MGGATTLAYENEDRNSLIPLLMEKGYRTNLILYINGKECPPEKARLAHPHQTLLAFLRDVMRLTGTKLGCAEGGCGACTVMMSRYCKGKDSIEHFSVNACLMPVCAADMCHITTIEGIGSTKSTMHPIQERMVRMHGSQCGFCTPGIIMALYSLFASGHVHVAEIEEHLDGNLCRCTGYRPIWDAAKSLCVDADATGPCGEKCVTCPARFNCDLHSSTAELPTSDAKCATRRFESVIEEDKKEEDLLVSNSTSKSEFTAIQEKLFCTSSKTKFEETNFRARLPDIMFDHRGSSFTRLAQPDVMFPDELKALSKTTEEICNIANSFVLGDDKCTWVKPSELEDFLELMSKHPDSKIVVGNTEVGIETKFKFAVHPRYVGTSSIPELNVFDNNTDHLVIGACTPLSTIQSACDEMRKSVSSDVRTGGPIVDMLRWFASTQIRNSACLGGNLATASPISDMNPMLACMGATLKIVSWNDHPRIVPVANFFISYRKVDMKPGEVIEHIKVPKVASQFEYLFPYKQAKRREDDISIVTAGMRVKVSPSDDGSHFVVTDASFAFGGMAPKTVLAPMTAKNIVGKPWNELTFDDARRNLAEELALDDDVPGGQAQYRLALVFSFFFRFYIQVTQEIAKDVEYMTRKVKDDGTNSNFTLPLPEPPILSGCEVSGGLSFVSAKKPSIHGTQMYPPPKVTPGAEVDAGKAFPKLPTSKVSSDRDGLGLPSTHASGALHCTGEAIYVDDMPTPWNMLHASLVLADKANCRLKEVDKKDALAIDGVVGCFTYDDLIGINGNNKLGPVLKDEEVFATDEIRHVGMVIGIIVAETLDIANAAARAVKVTYESIFKSNGLLAKPIISIEDAIEAESFFESTWHSLRCGDAGKDLRDAESNPNGIVVSGEYHVGGQEHFYLECHSTLVMPTETGLEVFASTQAPTKTQMCCASATGTAASQVTCRMKRMGGGFGGKETRNVFSAAAASVAAKITRRPVRLTLDRNVDMSITGARHTFLAKYTASAFRDPNNPDAPLMLGALKADLYANGGASLDLSGPIVDRALFHIDGTYKWRSFEVKGVACRTMQPPHTAFRGFGGPQGIAICEHVIDHLSSAVKIDSYDVRRANLYKVGNATPFGMTLAENAWNVPTAWDLLCSVSHADVERRSSAVKEFNKMHKWKKRGIAVIPTKFGIAFTAKFMNQGGALVHLYTDGTCLVSHGGTEMGQGLHTKVAQVAAHAFGISLAAVHIEETATDKVANTIPSAASQSTDLYGMATLDACRKILANIQPYRDRLGPDSSLAQVALAAHFDRVDLSAHGFYIVPSDRCGYEWDANEPEDLNGKPENSFRGQPFNYFTQGVAVSEVEIDVLTGDHRTTRSDIMVDVGSSLNPAIDIGQIEGAFIQGMGWSTIEEMIWADEDHNWVKPRGRLFTQGPGTYKLPAFNDTPETFNVTLMDTANPFAVHSSKAVGEPPFFLGSSVFYAIKDAVRAARIENLGEEVGNVFTMRMPSTSERIRMMCGDKFAVEGINSTTTSGRNDALSSEQNRITVLNFQPKGSY